MRAIFGLAICVALASCNFKPLPSAERLTQVAEAVRSGDHGRATKLATAYVPVDGALLDPGHKKFCSPEGVKAQIEDGGQQLSRVLASFATDESSAVPNYGQFRTEFHHEIVDRIKTVQARCPTSQASLMAAAYEAAEPIASAAETILAELKTKAENTGVTDLEAAADKAEKSRARATRGYG